MGIFIVILVVLFVGIWLGFLIGFSRAIRKAAGRWQTTKRPTIAWVFIGGAILCLLIAAGAFLSSWRFISTAKRTTGTVTAMREKINQEDDSRTFAPTFSFHDAAGVQHAVTSDLYSAPPLHQIGDTVPILYRPSDPNCARIDSYCYHWGIPTITAGLGAFYLPTGFIILRWPQIVAKFRRQRPLAAS